MKIKAFTLNEIGGRKNVEDAIMPKNFSGKEPSLFIVCDGVGGSSFGEVASELATKSFYEIFTARFDKVTTDFQRILIEALTLFQLKVGDYVDENPGAANTSTTLTLAVLKDNKAYIAWCGDSKIYQLRNGNIIYKSKDHSLVAELVSQGVITEKEAESHPQRNIITRSLNSHTKSSDIEYEIIDDVQTNDWFLLCTDGLLEQFTENLFPAVLGNYNAETNYSDVIDKICRGKTKDNYSMYLLHLEQAKTSSSKKIFLFVIILVVLAAGGWFAFTSSNKTTPLTSPEAPQQTESGGLLNKGAGKKVDSNNKIEKDTVKNIKPVAANSKDSNRNKPTAAKLVKPLKKDSLQFKKKSDSVENHK